MLVRSIFFLQLEKMKKLLLSLSKQYHNNKMLKIKSEMLKIRKNVKIFKLEKISRENFREFLKFLRNFLKIPRFLGS